MATNPSDKSKKMNKRTNALSWVKNAGKSLGFSTMDMIKEIMPATFSTIEANAENVSETIDKLKGLAKNRKIDINDYLDDTAKQNISSIKRAIANAKEDIATGKLYNKEREDKDRAWDNDLDFDFDDSLSDSSFEFDDVGEPTETDSGDTIVVSPKIKINSNISKNNPMVKAISEQSDVIAKSNEAAMHQNAQLATSSLAVSQHVVDAVSVNVGLVNENLGKLLDFNTVNVNKYIHTSLKYYEDSIRILQEGLDEYKRVNSPRENTIERKEDPLENVFVGDGGFNVAGYLQLAKKQLGTAIDNDFVLSQIKTILGDSGTIADMASNPLRLLSDAIVKRIFPQFIKTTLSEFDKSIRSFIPALLTRVTNLRSSTNPIFKFIGDVLGIKSEYKTSFDTDTYDKGPMPFNGKTQKAITEVIPGYLSKILSAVSGSSAKVYNYETGQFSDISALANDAESRRTSTILSQYEGISTLKDRLNAFEFEDQSERRRFDDLIDKFFLAVTAKGQLVSPNVRKDKNGTEIDSLKEVMQGIGASSNDIELMRALIKSLDNSEQMKMFGEDMLSARKAQTDRMYQLESDPTSAVNMLYNNLFEKNKDFVVGDKRDESKHKFSGITDKYGNSVLSYLRNIHKTMLTGVRISKYDNPAIKSQLELYKTEDTRIKRSEPGTTYKDLTEDEKRKREEKGITVARNVSELPDDPNQLNNMIRAKMERDTEEPKEKDAASTLISKFLSGNIQEKYNLIKAQMDKIFQAPAKLLNTVFKKLDNSMYDLVFGVDNRDGEMTDKKSFFDSIILKITSSFNGFFGYLKENIFEPLKEYTKNIRLKTGNFLFGEKDLNGNRKGGLFSSVSNEISDVLKGFKHYFTGRAYTDSHGKAISANDNSVFSHVKNVFTDVKKTLKTYIFETEGSEKEAPVKGAVTDIIDSLKSGFQSFSDAIFGPKNVNGQENSTHVNIDEVTKKIKERAPKALAGGVFGAGAGLVLGGKLGLLGSLFLPGGPIGGAIVGTTLGFISQSDRFKDWLFGTEDEITHERIGGIISKSTQDFFKKHKTAMIGGAAVGAAKSALGIGILPGFILGGPVGGAVLGMASSLLFKSEKFQTMLFGEADETGKRTGGFVSKILGTASSADTKKRLGVIGAGTLGGIGAGALLSHFGVLGAFAFNPLLGAIAGAASGIALSSEKWKKALFGEFKTDEETGETYRKGGLIGRFSNMVSVEVLQPLRVKLLESKFKFGDWFDEKIADPFLSAIAPVKEEVTRIKKRIGDAITGIKDAIVNSPIVKGVKTELIDPILNGFRDYVFNPFKTVIGKIFDTTTHLIGKVISSPFTLLRKIGDRLQGKHERQGIHSIREMAIRNLKNSEVGKFINENIVTPVKTGISTVVSVIKKGTSWIAKKIAHGISSLTIGALKLAGGAISLPFKALGLPFKAIRGIRNYMRGNRNVSVSNEDRLQQIRDGQRGFFGSVRDIIETYIPSTLRHDARFGKEGASYAQKRQEEERKRAEERAKKKAQHEETIAAARKQLDINQSLAKQLGYDTEGKDGKSVNSIYKSIDKQMRDQYGKEWKTASAMDRDRFKADKLNQITNGKIEKNTSGTVIQLERANRLIQSIIENGLHIPEMKSKATETNEAEVSSAETSAPNVEASTETSNNAEVAIDLDANNSAITDTDGNESNSADIFENSPLAQQFKAAQDVNEKEESKKQEEIDREKELKSDQIEVSSNTAENRIASVDADNEGKTKKGFMSKIASLLQRGNEERERQGFSWDTIFSKKGLITGALLLGIPLIGKLFELGKKWSEDLKPFFDEKLVPFINSMKERFENITESFESDSIGDKAGGVAKILYGPLFDKKIDEISTGIKFIENKLGWLKPSQDEINAAQNRVNDLEERAKTDPSIRNSDEYREAINELRRLNNDSVKQSGAGNAFDEWLNGKKIYLTDQNGNIVVDSNGNGQLLYDQYGNIKHEELDLPSSVRQSILRTMVSMPKDGWTDRQVYVTDENGNAIVDENNNFIKAVAGANDTDETVKLKYGQNAYIGEDGTIKSYGSLSQLGVAGKQYMDTVTLGFSNDAEIRERLGLSPDVEIKFTDRLANMMGNSYAIIPGADLGKMARSFSKLTNVFDQWWNGNVLDEDGNPIIDDITGKPVKVNKISNFIQNTIPKLSINVGSFIKGIGVSISDWWNTELLDEDGNPIIDDITGKPVKANGVANFIHRFIYSNGKMALEPFYNIYKGIINIPNIEIFGFKDSSGKPVTVKTLPGVLSAGIKDVGTKIGGFFKKIFSLDNILDTKVFGFKDKSGNSITIRQLPDIIKNTLSEWNTNIGNFVNSCKPLNDILDTKVFGLKDKNGNTVTLRELPSLVTDGIKEWGKAIRNFLDIFSPITNWWNKDALKDENGNVVKDMNGAPVKIKQLGVYIKDSLSKITNLFGSIFGLNGFGSILGNVDDFVSNMIRKGQDKTKGTGGPVKETTSDEDGIGGPSMDIFNSRLSINSNYGKRILNGVREGHSGIDMGYGKNAPIRSFTNGTVTRVVNKFAPDSASLTKYTGNDTYGNHIIVRDENGKYNLYGHLNRTNVQPGDSVKVGDILGIQGNTGRSTGSHLHYEVRQQSWYGSDIDPAKYVELYDKGQNYTESGAANTNTAISITPQMTEPSNEIKQSGIFSPFLNLTSVLTDSLSEVTNPLNSLATDIKGLLFGTSETTSSNNTGVEIGTDVTSVGNVNSTANYSNSGDIQNQSLTNFKPITEAELKKWIARRNPNSDYINKAGIFIQASNETGLDPRYLVAHAATESGWFAESKIANTKHNYFGIEAYNNDPVNSAKYFGTTPEEGIIGGAKWIKEHFTDRGQDTLNKMIYLDPNHRYAVNDDGSPNMGWIKTISSIMENRPGDETTTPTTEFGLGGRSTFEDDRIRTKGGVSYVTRDIYTEKMARNISRAASTKDTTSTEDSNLHKLAETMIDFLSQIAENTGTSKEVLKEMKDKAIESITSGSSTKDNITVVKQGNSTSTNPMFAIANNRKQELTQRRYATAKQIAQAL